MDWRKYFLWVPHWVPFLGMSSTEKMERELLIVTQVKDRFQKHIEQGQSEIAHAERKKHALEVKIQRQKRKQEASQKAMKRSLTIIGNINKFIGEDEEEQDAA